MRIKKSKGKIFGAELTAAERKALDMEICRQAAEFDRKHELEMQATVLWTLHEQFGFGYNRLKQFYKAFDKTIDDLLERYEMGEQDRLWICTHKLKQIGVDIEEWSKNIEKE